MNRRGLTIAEALLTGFMLAMVLGMLASLAREYSYVMSFTGLKDRTLSAVESAVSILRADLEAAQTVGTPTAPDVLLLTRTDASVGDDVRLVETSGPNWQPAMASWILTVTYRIDNESLIRRVTSTSGGPFDTVLATGVRALIVSDLGSGLMEIKLTFLEANNRVVVVRTLVARRLEQEP